MLEPTFIKWVTCISYRPLGTYSCLHLIQSSIGLENNITIMLLTSFCKLKTLLNKLQWTTSLKSRNCKRGNLCWEKQKHTLVMPWMINALEKLFTIRLRPQLVCLVIILVLKQLDILERILYEGRILQNKKNAIKIAYQKF